MVKLPGQHWDRCRGAGGVEKSWICKGGPAVQSYNSSQLLHTLVLQLDCSRSEWHDLEADNFVS